MTRKRVWNRFESYFTLQSLHKVLPSFTSYHKRCRNYFLVLLCTTSLAQSTSQYYLVLQKQLPILNGLQGLRKVLPSTTLYCKAWTKHFPLLLCTAKSAQSTSQSETNLNRIWNESETNLKRIFVLGSLLKVLPSIFPESVWAQGSSNNGGLYLTFSSSHLLIFTSTHLHICSSSHLLSHLLIFTSSLTSAHLHICSSSYLLSHLLIFTSAHLHIFSHVFSHIFSHLLIFLHIFSHIFSHICSSSHLLIFTFAHLHIFSHICSSSHLLIFTSSLTSAHLHICSSSHLLSHLLTFTSSLLSLSFFSLSPSLSFSL